MEPSWRPTRRPTRSRSSSGPRGAASTASSAGGGAAAAGGARAAGTRARGRLVKAPWAARDDYIHVILDRSEEHRAAFFSRHQRGPLEPPRQVEALRLLELQRHRLLMFTSCGWFFDDISGLEATQVLKYAARAMQLAAGLGFSGLEEEFARRLAAAPSNVPEYGNGTQVFRRAGLPGRGDVKRLVAPHR